MIRRWTDWAIGSVCLVCVGYVFFFVPVGRRTLFQHAWRIAQTEPAQELAEDARQKAGELSRRLAEEIEQLAADGGVAPGAGEAQQAGPARGREPASGASAPASPGGERARDRRR
jgi:hypothetical protein